MRRIIVVVALLTGLAGCEWKPSVQPGTPVNGPATSAPGIPDGRTYVTAGTSPPFTEMQGSIPKIQLFDCYLESEQHFQLFESIDVVRPVFKDPGKIEHVVEHMVRPTAFAIKDARALHLDGAERDLQQTLKELANQQPVLVIRPGQTIHPAIQKQFPATMIVLEIAPPRVIVPADRVPRASPLRLPSDARPRVPQNPESSDPNRF